MKNSAIFAITALCAGCSSSPVIPPGGSFATPLGGMTCRTDPAHLPAELQTAFGPHGGTLRLVTELTMTRIDVEEFSPTFETKNFLPHQFDDFYTAYLNRSTVPLVRSGVPDARLLGQQADQINGNAVQLSAVLLPQRSGLTYADGRREDGIRVQLLFTNGRFIYTMSETAEANPRLSQEDMLQMRYARLRKKFATCSFKQ